MTSDLDQLEQVAKAAQERSPGPWRRKRSEWLAPDSAERFDYIYDSSPKPKWFDDYDGSEWIGNRVVETDGGYYEPKGVTGQHIATFSPDVVLRLIARIRELEKRCHIVESHPPDFAIEGEPLETQVFVLKERLMDERHKSYQLECEVAAAEHHIEACSEAAYIPKGQCQYCDGDE
jgi:hypothetical protein